MYETVLVTDRGFLSVRVIRSCQRLGIKAVALVLPGEESAPHAQAADETVPYAAVGPAELVSSVLEAAQVSGAQAVHPGGSLPVQAAELAGVLRAAGLDWLGPDTVPDAARLSDGDVGLTLVEGRVVDGWRWLARGPDRPGLAESATPPRALVELAEAAVDARWPVASVSAGSRLERVAAVRPALAGVDRLVEARTGVDLVARQLGADRGEPVGAASGHAVCLALFARPEQEPGPVRGWHAPPPNGVVIDTALADGRMFTAWPQDPLVLLTAAGADRPGAMDRLRAALEQLEVQAPDLDLPGVRAQLRDPSVVG